MSDRLNAEVQALRAVLDGDDERLDDVLRSMDRAELTAYREKLFHLREAIEVRLGWREPPDLPPLPPRGVQIGNGNVQANHFR